MDAKTLTTTATVAVAIIAIFAGTPSLLAAQQQQATAGVPIFEVDPFWPKFDDKWIFGSIGGIAVDPTNDHVFVLNRPRTIAADEDFAARTPPQADCCVPAPHVMEFDPAGKFLRGWGGKGAEYEWPDGEHGITIDYRGNAWISGNGQKDTQVLKFTKTGKFLLQIGKQGKTGGSNDTENFNRPTKASVYPKTNEVFISDGYGNRRVIVFDADTGKYKRHWGAYGNKPDDAASRERVFEGPGPQQFNLVHGVVISNDDLVYVTDRSNNRIQVFRPDGTFVKEGFIARATTHNSGTSCDLVLSPDKEQKFVYVTDPGNHFVHIIERSTLRVVGKFGRLGHAAGQFYHLHVLAIDSKGNIYTGENTGKRIQKWMFKGLSPASSK